MLAELTNSDAESLVHDWEFIAREDQLPPQEPWQSWLYMAGRGAGKTRSGAEWIRAKVKDGCRHLGLIAPTAGDIRDVMIEGVSGVLSVSWNKDRDCNGNLIGIPTYEPSKRHLLTWANGATCRGYSAEEPDRLRGPQFEALWGDEIAAWPDPNAAWDMAMFGLRLGTNPQAMISTTPRPIPILRELLRSKTCVVTTATTYANRAHLAGSFINKIIAKYEGTRLGRQELAGELIEEAEGALWTREMLDQCLVKTAPGMRRVVVAIDPAVTANEMSSLTGIIVAGLGVDGRGYVLKDLSGRYSPAAWAREAIAAFDFYKADRIVAEGNQGGDLVRYTIDTAQPNLPIRIVHAMRSKQARAEPVAALYEQNKVFHVGAFPELEDQMCVAGDTLIITERGQIAARNVRLTDTVLTRQGFYPLKFVGQTGIKPTILVQTSFGSYVRLTRDHPVFVAGKGFVRAADLRVGYGVLEWCGENELREPLNVITAARSIKQSGSDLDFVVRPVVESSTIVAIKTLSAPIPVYDLTINGPPEFFANRVLVHNCTWVPLSGMPSPDRLDAMVWAFTDLMVGGAQVVPIVIPFSASQARNVPG